MNRERIVTVLFWSKKKIMECWRTWFIIGIRTLYTTYRIARCVCCMLDFVAALRRAQTDGIYVANLLKL